MKIHILEKRLRSKNDESRLCRVCYCDFVFTFLYKCYRHWESRLLISRTKILWKMETLSTHQCSAKSTILLSGPIESADICRGQLSTVDTKVIDGADKWAHSVHLSMSTWSVTSTSTISQSEIVRSSIATDEHGSTRYWSHEWTVQIQLKAIWLAPCLNNVQPKWSSHYGRPDSRMNRGARAQDLCNQCPCGSEA